MRLDTVMFHAISEGGWRATELEGRTTSFATLEHAPTDGPLQFRTIRKYGACAAGVVVPPRRRGITPELSRRTEAQSTANVNERCF
jgi:hypothetical protein